MNWLIKLGEWWESRRVLRKPDLKTIQLNYQTQDERITKLEISNISKELLGRVMNLEERKEIPQAISKELALLNIRLNKLELFVGLKREQELPTRIKGEARIS